MFWPYMIPYAITVADAAAPDASLRFLFYGGVVVLPVIAIYTIGVYWVFRGKMRHALTCMPLDPPPALGTSCHPTRRAICWAGLTLASMNIPQVLGYTRIAGTPVVTGLYTVLLPLVAFARLRLVAPPGRRRRFGDRGDLRERAARHGAAGERAVHGVGRHGGAVDGGVAAAGARYSGSASWPTSCRAQCWWVSSPASGPGRHRDAAATCWAGGAVASSLRSWWNWRAQLPSSMAPGRAVGRSCWP